MESSRGRLDELGMSYRSFGVMGILESRHRTFAFLLIKFCECLAPTTLTSSMIFHLVNTR